MAPTGMVRCAFSVPCTVCEQPVLALEHGAALTRRCTPEHPRHWGSPERQTPLPGAGMPGCPPERRAAVARAAVLSWAAPLNPLASKAEKPFLGYLATRSWPGRVCWAVAMVPGGLLAGPWDRAGVCRLRS